jgi:hypothetical protein
VEFPYVVFLNDFVRAVPHVFQDKFHIHFCVFNQHLELPLHLPLAGFLSARGLFHCGDFLLPLSRPCLWRDDELIRDGIFGSDFVCEFVDSILLPPTQSVVGLV